MDILSYAGLIALGWNIIAFISNRRQEKEKSLSKFYQEGIYKYIIENNICMPCISSNLSLLNTPNHYLIKEKLLDLQKNLTTVQKYLTIFYSINDKMTDKIILSIDDHIDNIMGIFQDIEEREEEQQNYKEIEYAALLFIAEFYASITKILDSITSSTINSLSKHN